MAMSAIVTDALDDTSDDADDVTLEAGMRVTSVAVIKANEWCEHRIAQVAAVAQSAQDDASSWDDAFARDNIEIMIDIILAANYLHAEPLIDFGCNAMAAFIRDNSLPRVRELIGVAAEFTPEEEARMIAEATAEATPPLI